MLSRVDATLAVVDAASFLEDLEDTEELAELPEFDPDFGAEVFSEDATVSDLLVAGVSSVGRSAVRGTSTSPEQKDWKAREGIWDPAADVSAGDLVPDIPDCRSRPSLRWSTRTSSWSTRWTWSAQKSCSA